MQPPEATKYPLCSYFLSGYLAATASDDENFPPGEFPAGFERYEILFRDALTVLDCPKEKLKGKTEFNFDSVKAASLEGGIGILRAVIALHKHGFSNIALVPPKKETKVADIVAERNGQKVCFEVKTITKQSSGRAEFYLEEQLYEKIFTFISEVRAQLNATALEMGCTLKVFVCVFNWLTHSIVLGTDAYQWVVNKLEKNEEHESLHGVDGVFFIDSAGSLFPFLNEDAKAIDF